MPDRPLLIYDGECRFCCRWVEWWKELTGDRVDYATSQSAGLRFPQIASEKFAQAVQFVGEDGTVCSGAEAVFSALATATWYGRAAFGLYRRMPWFARGTEAAYGVVARNRGFFSLLTRMVWGNDVRPPAYAVSSWIFLRLLGGIYLLAFLSFGMQLDGLIGDRGILPATEFFTAAGQAFGGEAFWRWPGVFWWTGAGNAVLHGACWTGAAAAVLLIVGFVPGPSLIVMWGLYLSLTVAGQDFYQFQWDILLLETGFLAVFLVPWKWWARTPSRPPRLAHFLLIWLLFRLVFASAMVKLTSGDPAWINGTALEYHYFTQPLPTPLAWYVHQLPGWFHWLSVKGMFFIELVLPFLLFCPRQLRLTGVTGIALLQVVIALTGNYGFFNFLTLALCLLAVDDAVWGRRVGGQRSEVGGRYLPRALLIPVAVLVFLLSLVPLASSFRRPMSWLEPLAVIYEKAAPFRTVNGYGLFAVMTTERREIIVQGSDDALHWKTYVFRFKPGDPRRAPPWVAPWMPRLDWQMWFAALGSAERNPWFVNFLIRLLEASPHTLDLLAGNPFPDGRPRYVRALSDRYTFTTPAERKQSGEWWRTEPLAIYYPEISLKGRLGSAE